MRRTQSASALALSVLIIAGCGGAAPDGVAGLTTVAGAIASGGPAPGSDQVGSGGADSPPATTPATSPPAELTSSIPVTGATTSGGSAPGTADAGAGRPASATTVTPPIRTATRGTSAPAATATPGPVAGDPATEAPEPAPEGSTLAPVATGTLVATTCSGPVAPGDGNFDLLAISARLTPAGYAFAARYAGSTSGRHVLVRFTLEPSVFVVDGELFEDGKGVGRVLDTVTSGETFLDPPQTITTAEVDLAVRTDQLLGLTPPDLAVTVTMQVDGVVVEVC